MIKYLGSKTLGAISLALGQALPALDAYLKELLSQNGELAGRLEVYARFSGAVADPTTLAAQLAAAIANFPAQLSSIALGAMPSVTTAVASVNADMLKLAARLNGLRMLYEALSAAASAGGVHAFAVDSTPANVGPELAAEVSGGMPGGGLPGARIRGVIFLTENPATYTAMSTFFPTG